MRDRRHRLLLGLARRGSEDAFRRLYGELYGPVAGYVAARTTPREDAEDLTSDVFHRFVARIDRYDPTSGSVLTWLLAMAHNAVVDHHRRRRAHGAARERTVPVDEMADRLAAASDDPLGRLTRDEDLRDLDRLVRRLPAETREMFNLRFGEGLNVREVATVLGLGEDAVKQRFARALRQIRSELSTTRSRREEGGPACATSD